MFIAYHYLKAKSTKKMYNFTFLENNKSIIYENQGGKMKATGVVRRIDDLGRIVIPKEIRKTLRIKEGSPLEIFTEKEGDIILRKYSPIGEILAFSSEYAESLAKVTDLIAIITDKDTVIAVSGTTKKDLLEQKISQELEKIIDKREAVITDNKDAILITEKGNKEKEAKAQVIVPIISDSELVGSIILLSKEQDTKLTESEKKIAEVAASFLGNQMEI